MRILSERMFQTDVAFFCQVMYTAEGWLDRNNDTVSEEKLLPVIAEAFAEP